MIFNMVGGGGGSGATLVVSSPANVSVTVSKDDKSYTKNSGSLGSTTFKGLATGTWVVTISGNGQTATKTIEITADYAITIAFFSATINITYPANSNCVVTNSSGQTVASDTNTGSSTKTWTATVGATGTYTVTATATDGSGKSKSTTVNITTDGQSESVTLSYELMLYDRGNQYTAVTGGWKLAYKQHGGSSGTGSVSFGASSATITPASYTSTSMATVNKINLDNVKTLNVTLDRYDDNTAAVIVNSSKQNPDLNYDAGDYTVYKSIPSGGTSSTSKYSGTVSLDVSSLSGNYYIVIGSRGGDAGSGKIVVYKVWGDPN